VEAIPARGDSFDPANPWAPALFVLTGRGVAGGRGLGEVPLIDVAPTLTRLLGLLAPPAQAQGQPIERALSSDTR
jgi:hypothetical protein